MLRSRSIALAALLALAATAASAQIYPLTNGPDGREPNTLDSARGWDGINSIAPERELIYHPERAGNAYATYRAEMAARENAAAPEVAPAPRHRRHRRRHDFLR